MTYDSNIMSVSGRSCHSSNGNCINNDFEEDYPYTPAEPVVVASHAGQYHVSGGRFNRQQPLYQDGPTGPEIDYYRHVKEQLRRSHASDPLPRFEPYTSQNEVYIDNDVPASTMSINGGAIASTADGENRCSCEYLMFENFKWIKQQHYAVVKDGREYFDRYVVTYRLPNSNLQYDMFTYSEGVVHSGPIETKFPHLCGEVLSFHPLPPVNSLSNVCYFIPPLVDPDAPFHVQEEVCKSKSLAAVPLKIDTTNQVLVFRTYNDTLALQLMPTAYSERSIISGTPLFHGIRRNISATVGSMFSEFHYVINGSPCSYALFSIGAKEKNDASEGDRMRLIVLDRRDRLDSEEWTANETVLNSISDVALPVLQRYEGKHANLDVRDVLYVGVVNSNLQLTDAPNVSKKYKPPKNTVVAVIDNMGVYAVLVRDKDVVSRWVQKDANVTYSVLPRHFFDKPRSSVVRINTADTNAKLKRTKSREMLI